MRKPCSNCHSTWILGIVNKCHKLLLTHHLFMLGLCSPEFVLELVNPVYIHILCGYNSTLDSRMCQAWIQPSPPIPPPNAGCAESYPVSGSCFCQGNNSMCLPWYKFEKPLQDTECFVRPGYFIFNTLLMWHHKSPLNVLCSEFVNVKQWDKQAFVKTIHNT